MPRNRSEKDPYPVLDLTPSRIVNEYIRAWYRLHWSPEGRRTPGRRTAVDRMRLDGYSASFKISRSQLEALPQSVSENSWATIHPDGQSHISGHQLRDLYRAAQQK